MGGQGAPRPRPRRSPHLPEALSDQHSPACHYQSQPNLRRYAHGCGLLLFGQYVRQALSAPAGESWREAAQNACGDLTAPCVSRIGSES